MPTPTHPSSPSLGERIVSTVDAPDRTEEQLQALLKEIHATPDAKKPQVLDNMKQTIAGMDATKRTTIEAKLQTLEKESFSKLTESELEQLRGVTEVMRTELAIPQAPAATPTPATNIPTAPAAAPQASDVTAEKKWYKPQTWTPEERTRAAMYAGTGIAVVGGILLAKWLIGRAKNTAESVKEKTKTGWKWLKWGALAGVLTVGGYIGIKAAKDQIEKMGLRKLQEQWTKVQDRLANVQNLTVKEYAALKQKRAELEEKMKAYLTQPTVGSAPAAAPVAPTVADRARETGAEAVETGTDYAIASSLARFCPSPDWARVNADKQNTIYGIMRHTGNATLTIGAITNGTRAFVVGEENETTAEDNRQATELLRTFCTAQKPKLIERMVKRDGLTQEAATAQVDAMPFVPFIKQAASAFVHAEQAAEILQRAYANREALLDLDKLGTLSDLSEDLKMQLRTFMDKSIPMTEEEKAKITTDKLVQLALHKAGIFVRALEEPKANAPTEEKALYRFVTEEAATRETAKSMLPFFHKVFLNPDVWSETNMEHNITIVTGYMQDWMTVDQVLRMYLYRKMIEAGNPAGVVLMQAAMLKYVTVREYGGDNLIGLKTKKYDMMQRIAEKFTASGMEEFSEEWEKLYEMDPTALEQAQEILGSVLTETGKGIVGIIAGSVQEGASAVKSAITENRKTAAAIAVAVPTAAYRVYAWKENYAPYEINNNLRKSGSDWFKRRILHRTGAKFYTKTASEFDTIFNAIKSDTTLLKSLEKCCKSQGSQTVWNDLLTELIVRFPTNPDVINAAEHFTKYSKARDIVANTRNAWNSIPFVKPATRAIGSMKRGVVSAAKNTIGRIPVPAPLAKIAGLVKGTVVLDTAVVGYEAYNYFANERPRLLSEIENEQDPAKKAQLERELDYGNSASLGFNAVGTGLLYTPFMPVGVVMLAGNAGRMVVNDSIEAGTTYMLKTEKELERESAGQILQHIGQTAPGQFATWGQGLAANPANYLRNPALAGIPDPAVGYVAPDMSDTFDEANEGARMEGYRAYFRQAAQMVLPRFTEKELSEADQKLSPTEIASVLSTRAQGELGYFATAALTYLKETTRGRFTLVDPVMLRKAELYAKQCTLTNRIDLSHPEKAVEDHRTLSEKMAKTEKAYATVEDLQAKDIASLSGHPSVFAQQAPWKLLLAVRHELAACETKILTTDYSNWSGTLSGHWQSEENLQAIARGAFAERTLSIVRDLINSVQAGTPTTPEQITQTIAAMRLALVDGNPDDIAFESIDQGRDTAYEKLGNNAHLLSFDTMWALIQATLPAAPTVTPARPATPPSTTPAAAATAA